MLAQLERLAAAVAAEPHKVGTPATANRKVLAALQRLMFVDIPADPMRPEYRQGNTLGSNRRHWFRAKFAAGRFRLFFRFHRQAKVIVFAWVNDQDSLRTYGAATDAYAVFTSMLDRGNPPDTWEALVAAARDPKHLANMGVFRTTLINAPEHDPPTT